MKNNSSRDDYCRNCYQPLQMGQRYCGHCGQKRTTGHVSLWELLRELFSTIFNLENKTLSTLSRMVQPGRLTRDYFKGRHKRYGHPVRIFFVSTVALIAVISFKMSDFVRLRLDSELDTHDRYYGALFLDLIDSSQLETNLDSTQLVAMSFKDTLEKKIINKLDATRKDTFEFDNIQLFGEKSPPVLVTDLYEMSQEELEKKYVKDATFTEQVIFRQKVKFTKNMSNFIVYMIGRLSWLLILLLPLVAIFMKLLYIRHSIYYVEHLVFSMHVHSFIFLLLFIISLFNEQIGKVIFVPVMLVVPVYLFLAMKYYYQQGIFKTLAKFLLIGFVYFILVIICAFVTLLLGFVFF